MLTIFLFQNVNVPVFQDLTDILSLTVCQSGSCEQRAEKYRQRKMQTAQY